MQGPEILTLWSLCEHHEVRGLMRFSTVKIMGDGGLPKPQCRQYCPARQSVCHRLDCMACLHCHPSESEVRRAALGARFVASVNCTTDGSFTINTTRWPAPFHELDEGVARTALQLAHGESLVDIGAGSGQYGAYFEARRKAGAVTPMWSGYDGAANIESYTSEHGPPGALVKHANICAPALRLPRASWAMSLEVGEHLPASCLGTYVRLLGSTARCGLLVSWARPGQGGRCHISSRTMSWVEAQLSAVGFQPDWSATSEARRTAHLGYLKHTLLVLRRRETAPRCGASSASRRRQLSFRAGEGGLRT